MRKLLSLLKKTEAYSVIQKEKEGGALSHAYLAICKDGGNLTKYLRLLAMQIICKESEPCLTCRNCGLIASDMHADVLVYPREGDGVKVEDIENLIEQSYIKPLETEKKIFILTHAENMNVQSQNKLLKTLEEPPKNVIILIGATSEYGLLSTVLSRVKKLCVKEFTERELIEYFGEDEKVLTAISMSDGTVSDVERLLGDENFEKVQRLSLDIIFKMQSSRDVLEYSERVSELKDDFLLLLSVLELLLRDMLLILEGREDLVKNKRYYEILSKETAYKAGAVMGILDKINQARKRLKFNANKTMLTEWVLFQILEEKYKWQKL